MTQLDDAIRFFEDFNRGINEYVALRSDKAEIITEFLKELRERRAYDDKINALNSTDRLYTAHEVAEILMDVLGEECPCNLKCTDEWLSEKCEISQYVCPDCGIEGWMQFLKYRGNEE